MNKEAFSQRLKQAIKLNGLSIKEAAERAGISWNVLYRWCGKKTEPGVFKLSRLAKEINVNIDWLIDGESSNASKRSRDRKGPTSNKRRS